MFFLELSSFVNLAHAMHLVSVQKNLCVKYEYLPLSYDLAPLDADNFKLILVVEPSLSVNTHDY